MIFGSRITEYSSPDASSVHLLPDMSGKDFLTFNEIKDMTNSPYTDGNWSQLSYFVSKNSFSPYYNEDLGRIADRNLSRGNWIIDKTSINCLFYTTCLRMPTVCDWTRHFLFFTAEDFFGSLGVYALKLAPDVSENMTLMKITDIAQYQLTSNSPFNRFLVAIVKENKWELAFGEILPTQVPKNYIKARKVKISLLKEPSSFFQELLNGGKVSRILCEEYIVNVRV